MKRHQPIPRFKTDEEEARYWDTHDLADHWDELEVAGDVTFNLPPRPPKVPGKRPGKVVYVLKLGKNGSISIPPAIRRLYGLQEGSNVGCILSYSKRKP